MFLARNQFFHSNFQPPSISQPTLTNKYHLRKSIWWIDSHPQAILILHGILFDKEEMCDKNSHLLFRYRSFYFPPNTTEFLTSLCFYTHNKKHKYTYSHTLVGALSITLWHRNSHVFTNTHTHSHPSPINTLKWHTSHITPNSVELACVINPKLRWLFSFAPATFRMCGWFVGQMIKN